MRDLDAFCMPSPIIEFWIKRLRAITVYVGGGCDLLPVHRATRIADVTMTRNAKAVSTSPTTAENGVLRLPSGPTYSFV